MSATFPAKVIVVDTTAAIASTVAAAIVSAALLATAASILGASWLLLGGLADADCLAEHLKLSLDCQDIGRIQS
jgi:hypothetical protein